MFRTILALFVAAVSLPALSVPGHAQEPRYLTIGTGAVTGLYYPAGGAVCRMVNRARTQHGIRCAVEATEGSFSNLGALRTGELDMAVTQSDWLFHAYKGSGRFRDQGPHKELRSVFALHGEPFTVVARVGAGIDAFEDLKGKRVNVGEPGSGNRAMMDTVMKAWGWTARDFSLASELPASEQALALCDNRVDAVAYAGGHPNGLIQQAASTCSVKLIGIDGRPVRKLLDDGPYYARVVIPGGMYAGNPDDVETFGVRAVLASSAEADAGVVYEVVKTVFDDFEAFRRLHPALQALEKASVATEGLAVPLHDGAARYFEEAGVR
ncbi:TAXI family TRAP transporter solute-binding subunit [Skermanella mucosa]|uniref:TAXI family TRAP transporter solute-binding subunit n=1 Tax=Skermanella mucosa TaxID=1789672 RepID=UPI00192AA006|nr:TAXI family TRAP transporter solute-binding subunit [Skermanella mucosa]UEM19553.1 TAXI family TRAP transporter solute-binding subunit [Skermanella mucosa]